MNVQRSLIAEKSRRYRARKQALGLRQVRIWVPDIRDPGFLPRIAQEGALLRAH